MVVLNRAFSFGPSLLSNSGESACFPEPMINAINLGDIWLELVTETLDYGKNGCLSHQMGMGRYA